MVRLISFLILISVSCFSQAKYAVDEQLVAAITQLNRLNLHLSSHSKGKFQQKKLYFTSDLDGTRLKVKKKEKTSESSKTLALFNEFNFWEILNTLKLSIEVTQDVEPKSLTYVANPFINKLLVDPKMMLDESLSLDVSSLNDNHALHRLCTNLIVLGYFSKSKVSVSDEYNGSALLCYAYYEVKTHNRDQTLFVMLADILGYEDEALSGAEYLDNVLFNYYYDSSEPAPSLKVINSLFKTLSELKFPDETDLEKLEQERELWQIIEDGYPLVENKPPVPESKNSYKFLSPDHPSLLSLLTLKRSVENDAYVNWQTIAFSAGFACSPSVMLHGIENLPDNELRSKLLMLTPLVLINDLYGLNEMSYYWFDRKLRTSIEDIDLLTHKLIENVQLVPIELIETFSQKLKKSVSPSGNYILSKNAIEDYWQSKLVSTYFVLANFLRNQNYHSDMLNGLAKVVQQNRFTPTGDSLSKWLLAIMPVENTKFNEKYLEVLIDENDVPLELKVSALLILRNQVDKNKLVSLTRELLPALRQKRHEFLRAKLVVAVLPDDVQALNDMRDWHNVRITPSLVDFLETLNNAEIVKRVLKKHNRQYILGSLHARLIKLLFKLDHGDEVMLTKLAELHKGSLDNITIIKAYLSVLIKYHPDNVDQQLTAVKILNDGLHKGKDLSRSQYLSMISLLAEAHVNLGKIDEAKRIINPTLQYIHKENFEIAMKIATKSDETKVGKKLLNTFSENFPEEQRIIAYYQYHFALIDGEMKMSAEVLSGQCKSICLDTEINKWLKTFLKLVKNKKITSSQKETFIQKLVLTGMPKKQVNKFRLSYSIGTDEANIL